MKNASVPITSAPARSCDEGCKDRVEVAFGAGMQDMELQPERAGRRLQRLSIWSRQLGLVGLTSRATIVACGHQLVQQLQPLWPQTSTLNEVTPVTLPPGRFEAGDKSKRDRVARLRRRQLELSWSPPLPPVRRGCYRGTQ